LDDAARQVTRRLGYVFEDEALLERALTHRSAGSRHNERLEFLGDSIVNFLIAEKLFLIDADAREGELTRFRALLVRRDTLAAVARDLQLGAALRLGGGELKSGGRDRDSILADAVEALIGAVFLDSNIDTCREIISGLFEGRIAEAQRRRVSKDSKTLLQEKLQSEGHPLPTYEVVDIMGAAHDQVFTVSCRIVTLRDSTLGTGGSRRQAEQAAARLALDLLDDEKT
jgi:ribonuclease-3